MIPLVLERVPEGIIILDLSNSNNFSIGTHISKVLVQIHYSNGLLTNT